MEVNLMILNLINLTGSTSAMNFSNFTKTDVISILLLILLAVVLVTAAVIDLRTMYVPDWVPGFILGLALISLFTEHGPTLTSRVCGSLVIGGAMLLVSILTKGGIGGGDIKLMAASGLLLGFSHNLLAFILAYLTAGLMYAIPLLTGRLDRHKEIPMIPYFAASILVSCLFGDGIINWYLKFFM